MASRSPDVDIALDRAMRRVAAFEADPLRMARQALKVILMFRLLDRQRLPLAGMADYVARSWYLSRFQC
jgi:hypothetical protein